ncbi:unnamed protein product [Cylicostephanus goldi]|uniref:Uncharacterized protein n=1 Tax=Cylicostephanus goldi TaxID=71465 RepID=A0A3P7MG59_CYLGO|nr:unnamed protein product [Cylicostephanus goldi]
MSSADPICQQAVRRVDSDIRCPGPESNATIAGIHSKADRSSEKFENTAWLAMLLVKSPYTVAAVGQMLRDLAPVRFAY